MLLGCQVYTVLARAIVVYWHMYMCVNYGAVNETVIILQSIVPNDVSFRMTGSHEELSKYQDHAIEIACVLTELENGIYSARFCFNHSYLKSFNNLALFFFLNKVCSTSLWYNLDT